MLMMYSALGSIPKSQSCSALINNGNRCGAKIAAAVSRLIAPRAPEWCCHSDHAADVSHQEFET
jgi:hypothetical protein